MIRVVQYWTRHPETGERVDVGYVLQIRDGDEWVQVPIIDVEIKNDQEDNG